MCLFYCVSDEDEDNQDTVEQILKCIIQNEGDRTHQYFLNIFLISCWNLEILNL